MRHFLSMTVRPNYKMEPLQQFSVSKQAAIRQLMGRTHHPQRVCEGAGDLERPVYLIKNKFPGNNGPYSRSVPPNVSPSSIMQELAGMVWVKSTGRVTWTVERYRDPVSLCQPSLQEPMLLNAVMRQ